jgi:hypothetical protein
MSATDCDLVRPLHKLRNTNVVSERRRHDIGPTRGPGFASLWGKRGSQDKMTWPGGRRGSTPSPPAPPRRQT